MDHYRRRSRSRTAMSSKEVAMSYPKCSQDHPNKEHRLESLTRRGDSRMLWSAAGHTVKYSVERFRIADLIDTNGWESCKKGRNCPAYFDEMYRFLVWKLGTPALGAAQWLSAGYEHFDKAYSDEAAGILLGLIDFRNVKPEI